ncbi:type II toxin-antitoxin system mRNA interferase toxin, RelE/StbE family [Campylobacter jejuni]|uniref:type II toxin-antitoxin system YafQ family toxin n=1 Tax=Campylobacter sp. BCW_6465 TaxID=1903582 RepID=UPI00087516BD|nr:type II toxin-antitoxin system YafQ family toxin [Campylobacter sp. BCW_6465]EAH6134426.1 type II toxin-antitoxin system YafQ family toxin [Campylobacter jejuni]HEH5557865.1 type II toxin-antitoxin system YafQ family toxin [Campylobacter coli]EAI2871992.1 type II toxin-antitoxin system YafQ family toxin [Campylobacter jejuni]EAI4085255.1 type II toxin-antitoxin system YafQ family toxin [Campylobacter jejuni]EAJ7142580.1 type II toxin-antitoxin system YafQ family toxin [Campylobacter jejuni]
MKYQIKLANRVKKRFEKLNTKEQDIFEYVVNKLANDEILEPKYKDHALKGNYIGFRECHIKPDLLLVYRKKDDILELYLASLGNHNNIF